MPSSANPFADLATTLLGKAAGGRCIAAIAGAPGSGKSTIADALKDHLRNTHGAHAQVLPMDGFHFDDAVLTARGDLARKGAPFTFDVAGLRSCLSRLAADTPEDVAVPVFDRSLEIARAGARIIRKDTQIILVEGNYLLLDTPDWRPLRAYFDLTIRLDCDMPTLRQRLLQRWRDHGYSEADALAKAEGNDLPNAELVCSQSGKADIALACDLALAQG